MSWFSAVEAYLYKQQSLGNKRSKNLEHRPYCGGVFNAKFKATLDCFSGQKNQNAGWQHVGKCDVRTTGKCSCGKIPTSPPQNCLFTSCICSAKCHLIMVS